MKEKEGTSGRNTRTVAGLAFAQSLALHATIQMAAGHKALAWTVKEIKGTSGRNGWRAARNACAEGFTLK